MLCILGALNAARFVGDRGFDSLVCVCNIQLLLLAGFQLACALVFLEFCFVALIFCICVSDVAHGVVLLFVVVLLVSFLVCLF